MKRRAALPAILLSLLATVSTPLSHSLLAAAPARTPAPRERAGAPRSHTDFSGTWQIDSVASAGGANNMEGAVLEVTQKEDRIWIQPGGDSMGRRVLAEELVVDGRPYEKALGGKGGKGTVTAKWGTDARSLWLEVTAGADDDPLRAVQRSVWRLSDDRSTWVRESVTLQQGAPNRQSRLVFRRFDPKKAGSKPSTTATPKPGRKAGATK